MSTPTSAPAPLVLTPGHWLGGWAWDDVAADLRARGHDVVPVTLPGLDPADPARATRTLADQVAALDAVVRRFAPGSAVLVVHSGANFPANLLLDADPGAVARVVYVDSGPVADGAAFDAEFPADAAELPLPPFATLARRASLDGLDEAALDRFRARAVPEPAPVLRERVALRDDARRDVPATIIACSFPSEVMLRMAKDGDPMMAETATLRDLEVVDLPTGHWPMWSRPTELAAAIAAAARGPRPTGANGTLAR